MDDLQEWNKQWKSIGCLKDAADKMDDLKDVVGLYKHVLDGKVVYVGKASEKKGGLKKRITDYIRQSDSARKSQAGKLIYENRAKIETYVLPVKFNDTVLEIAETAKLEILFINKYSKVSKLWNNKSKIY